MENICNVPFLGHLINDNYNIPDNILDAYYRQVPQPTSHDEIPKGYCGKLHRFNEPYQNCVYGANIFKPAWERLKYKMNHINDENGYYIDYTEERVYEALKNYAKGFQFGFDNFIKDKVDTPSLLSKIDTLKTQKVIDFLGSASTGFSETHFLKESKTPCENINIFDGWYNDGIQQGYRYCAWYLIFENYKLFEPYFQPKKNGKTKPVLKYDTLESIFNKADNIQKIIDCLISYETLNEKGELIKKAYHVSAISEALKIKGIINKKVSMTQRNKLFAEKFCIDFSDRTARAENKEHDALLTEYKELFDTVKFL